MEGRRVIRSLRLRNVLSFGAEGQTLELEPLNVLIGPNSSGKSNVLEILALLRALPRDVSAPIREGGGIEEWIWKGDTEAVERLAEVESTWEPAPEECPLRHRIVLSPGPRFQLQIEEEIVDHGQSGDSDYHHDYLYRRRAAASDPDGGPDYFDHVDRSKVAMALTGFKPNLSILAQRWDATRSPGLALVADRASEIRLYRQWEFGPGATVRKPQKADLPGDFLLEDGSNLGLVLNELMTGSRDVKARVLASLNKLYEGATDLRIKIINGYVQFHVEEEGGRLIPSVRLSDGTLRFLGLLAILCHPDPPPLVGIEEPELGMHPDVIPEIARLLIDASLRTQLIVTTHSADLVSELWEFPESVVVCARDESGSRLKRLDPDRLQKWLEDYSLGELWRSGEIGGNRW